MISNVLDESHGYEFVDILPLISLSFCFFARFYGYVVVCHQKGDDSTDIQDTHMFRCWMIQVTSMYFRSKNSSRSTTIISGISIVNDTNLFKMTHSKICMSVQDVRLETLRTVVNTTTQMTTHHDRRKDEQNLKFDASDPSESVSRGNSCIWFISVKVSQSFSLNKTSNVLT